MAVLLQLNAVVKNLWNKVVSFVGLLCLITGDLPQKRAAALPGRVRQIAGRCSPIGSQGAKFHQRGAGPIEAIPPGSYCWTGTSVSEAEGPLASSAPGEGRRAGQHAPSAPASGRCPSANGWCRRKQRSVAGIYYSSRFHDVRYCNSFFFASNQFVVDLIVDIAAGWQVLAPAEGRFYTTWRN